MSASPQLVLRSNSSSMPGAFSPLQAGYKGPFTVAINPGPFLPVVFTQAAAVRCDGRCASA
jgi:hypothetical protein